MHNQIRKLALTTALLGAFLGFKFGNTPIYSQYYGQNDSVPKIVIDKQVRPITDNKFYDNISIENKIFYENDLIEFKIVIENTGNITLSNVKMVDDLPNYLNLIFYPGIYNKTFNIIEAEIGILEPGQRKEYTIRAKTIDLPSSVINGKTFQQTNKVHVTSSIASDSDEAKYYIAAKVVPTTGANDLAIKTITVLSMTFIALGLRKYSRGY